MTSNHNDTTRAKKRVENLRKLLAKSIIELADANDLFQYECREHEWDEDLPYSISETIGKMGVHLASISQWFDEEEENEENEK